MKTLLRSCSLLALALALAGLSACGSAQPPDYPDPRDPPLEETPADQVFSAGDEDLEGEEADFVEDEEPFEELPESSDEGLDEG
ncbi:MAG: hypothetical protein OEY14_16840 [Myxococcales bacterium]|nr:hypothetical protein [Myxococcales bacterium]